jgi:hypothetical protein
MIILAAKPSASSFSTMEQEELKVRVAGPVVVQELRTGPRIELTELKERKEGQKT